MASSSSVLIPTPPHHLIGSHSLPVEGQRHGDAAGGALDGGREVPAADRMSEPRIPTGPLDRDPGGFPPAPIQKAMLLEVLAGRRAGRL